MNANAERELCSRIATVLCLGTWLASAMIALGLVLPHGASVVAAGIVLFIALPIIRVSVMLVAFLQHRDFRLGTIATLVLVVVLAGIALEAHTTAAPGLARARSTELLSP